MDVRHFQHFSELVKALRRRHKLSQRALAKALRVSPGYIGQWELRLSQPSADVTMKLCSVFDIEDIEHVQRLAFAQRAPQWLRESIVSYRVDGERPQPLAPVERRVVDAMRRLSEEQAERLAERVEGWVAAISDEPQP